MLGSLNIYRIDPDLFPDIYAEIRLSNIETIGFSAAAMGYWKLHVSSA